MASKPISTATSPSVSIPVNIRQASLSPSTANSQEGSLKDDLVKLIEKQAILEKTTKDQQLQINRQKRGINSTLETTKKNISEIEEAKKGIKDVNFILLTVVVILLVMVGAMVVDAFDRNKESNFQKQQSYESLLDKNSDLRVQTELLKQELAKKQDKPPSPSPVPVFRR